MWKSDAQWAVEVARLEGDLSAAREMLDPWRKAAAECAKERTARKLLQSELTGMQERVASWQKSAAVMLLRAEKAEADLAAARRVAKDLSEVVLQSKTNEKWHDARIYALADFQALDAAREKSP